MSDATSTSLRNHSITPTRTHRWPYGPHLRIHFSLSPGKTFSSACFLRTHRAVHHEGLRFPCDACEKELKSKADLQRHKAEIHRGVRHGCDLCPSSFSQKSKLNAHKRLKHLGDTKFACDSCGKAFSVPSEWPRICSLLLK